MALYWAVMPAYLTRKSDRTSPIGSWKHPSPVIKLQRPAKPYMDELAVRCGQQHGRETQLQTPRILPCEAGVRGDARVAHRRDLLVQLGTLPAGNQVHDAAQLEGNAAEAGLGAVVHLHAKEVRDWLRQGNRKR